MVLPPRRYAPAPGPDDFRQLRERGYFYVDKSAFIVEWLRSPHPVILLPRPRRFGKTLNLSMLRYFLERSATDWSYLFGGLTIAEAPGDIQEHRGRYPVIHLSLKDAMAATFPEALAGLAQVIAELCRHHGALADSPAMTAEDRAAFERLRAGRADATELRWSLRNLSGWAQAHARVPAVLLIDEYDAPIEAGYLHGYYDSIVEFMRGMLGAVLKSNPSLYRGVLTGVRRVSKESLFSDLNNVRISSMLEPAFATSFGFTEPEVRQILEAAGRAESLDDVRIWYNGYRFGDQTLYNPWSVLSFADTGVLRDHWAQTSADALLRRLLLHGEGLDGDFERLLEGGHVRKRVDEQVALRDLDAEQGGVWSVLLTAGYLKAASARVVDGEVIAELAIPNLEVRQVWRRSFAGWLQLRLGSEERLRALKRALFAGHAADIQDLLGPLVRDALSYHDVGEGPDGAPERVFHAFVLGLLVTLAPDHRVRSNRESGLGRADVLVIPAHPGAPGLVLEFKRVRAEDGETPAQAIATAQAQIAARGYRAELEAAGADPIRSLGVVFDGERVWVG